MNKVSCPLFFLLALFIFLQGCSPYKELEVKGPPNEKLDIILVPSHFYGQDAGVNKKWIADAEAIQKRLLEHHFWKNYRNKINMYRLDVSITNDFKDFGEGSWSPDDETIKEFAQTNVPLDFKQNDQIIFVIESAAYEKDPIYGPGRTRGDPNIVKLETDYLDVVVHEFGHSFGALYDEYGVNTSVPDWKSPSANIATLQPGDTCDDKWKDLNKVVIEAPGTWIESELLRSSRTVECYDTTTPGSKAQAFRPTNDACIMRAGDEAFPFCPVCQRKLVTLLNKYTPLDDKLYHHVETFQIPAEFEKATINPILIDFDQVGALYPKPFPPDWPQPIFKIDAPHPGVLAGRLYAKFGVSFTSGVILKEPRLSASSPNVLCATTLNPMERALIAGYFFSKRICAIGIYNTGLTSVTLRTYNAAFRETGKAAFVSNADTKTFIGIRATGPIYRFEIDAPTATGFSVDNLYFSECPK